MKEDMTLSEFISKTTAKFNGGEWVVKIPLFDGTIGNLFVTNADDGYEAKERAYLYLKTFFANKQKP
jgi:hypothetical protein